MQNRTCNTAWRALLLLGLAALGRPATAQVWQWSVPAPEVIAPETKAPPQAFLWIPPNCQRVRAVLIGQHNMLEEPLFEHPRFRAALARLGMAEVWLTPGIDLVFATQQRSSDQVAATLRALADASGYQELALAPVVPIGHSAAASYPWNYAAQNPARTLAAISLKGDAPLTTLTGSGRPNPDWGTRTLDGVPGLLVMGEYEWLEARLAPALTYQAQHPAAPLSLLADVGHGHFDVSDELVDYLALYLASVAALRLPATQPLDRPAALRPVDPRQGWRADRWHYNAPPAAPPAPYAAYRGDAASAFWYPDKVLALATEAYYARQRGKKPQLVGFVQNGKTLPQTETHQQLNLTFQPLADGRSFRLGNTYLDSVPAGNHNPPAWTHLPVGAPLGHASGPITISRIAGPVVQTGPDTWAVQFNRVGFNNPRRVNDIWLLAHQPGDATYESAVQQAELRIPYPNQGGTPQHLTFPALPDLPARTATGRIVALGATSDAQVPVSYYVLEGPAELSGNTLRLTPLPPRAKLPMKVTVVAWQYGRAPELQTAEPVARTFYLTK